MAVRQLQEYLENGNILHSVNFPDCDMGVCTAESRVVIFHKNIANMIAKFSSVLGWNNLNIANMMNKSKGDVAYTMVDLESSRKRQYCQSVKDDRWRVPRTGGEVKRRRSVTETHRPRRKAV